MNTASKTALRGRTAVIAAVIATVSFIILALFAAYLLSNPNTPSPDHHVDNPADSGSSSPSTSGDSTGTTEGSGTSQPSQTPAPPAPSTPNHQDGQSSFPAPSNPSNPLAPTDPTTPVIPTDPTPSFGRPYISQGTVLSSRGTLLRGLNMTSDVLTEELVARVPNNGFNAAHFYLTEGPAFDTELGAKAELCDQIVDFCEKEQLYLVITLGSFAGTEAENDFLVPFWEFYAQRYGAREHVIFEIANEMYFPTPLESGDRDMAAEAYRAIRAYAPDTLVLFYSFSNMLDWEHCVDALNQTQTTLGLDWSNEAVAFHGYEAGGKWAGPLTSYGLPLPYSLSNGPETMGHIITELQALGFPLINTEVPTYEESSYPNVELLRACEQGGVSWLSFLDVMDLGNPAFWRGNVEINGLTWEPDTSTWPVVDGLNPYEIRRAADDATSAEGVTRVEVGGRAALEARAGSAGMIDYERVAFGVREPLTFSATVRAPGGGTLVVYAQSEETAPRVTQYELARIELPADGSLPGGVGGVGGIGGWGDGLTDGCFEVSTYLHTPISGLSKLKIRIETGSAPVALCTWSFGLPPIDSPLSYTDPYGRTVAAAKYAFRSSGIVRLAADDPAASTGLASDFKVGGMTEGSFIEFDWVRFAQRDVTFKVRARTIAGGDIAILAGNFNEGTPFSDAYELGVCSIDGEPGTWQEFTCRLNLQHQPYWFRDEEGIYLVWNLRFEVRYPDDVQPDTADPTAELFELGEFSFVADGIPSRLEATDVASGKLKATVDAALATAGMTPDDAKYHLIRELVVTGTLNADDFDFIRTNMKGLWHLDLGGITNTELPASAFNSGELGGSDGVLKQLITLVLPAGLEVIGDYALADCSRLETISYFGSPIIPGVATLPNCLRSIGEGAFMRTDFVRINLSQTAMKSLGNWPFAGCERLQSLTLPVLDTLTNVGLIDECPLLTALIFTNPQAPMLHTETFIRAQDNLVIYYPAQGKGYTHDWLRGEYADEDGVTPGRDFKLVAATAVPTITKIQRWPTWVQTAQEYGAEALPIERAGRLVVSFDIPMDTSAAAYLQFDHNGGCFKPLYWLDNTTCVVAYSGLDDATTYEVTPHSFTSATKTHLALSTTFSVTTMRAKA